MHSSTKTKVLRDIDSLVWHVDDHSFGKAFQRLSKTNKGLYQLHGHLKRKRIAARRQGDDQTKLQEMEDRMDKLFNKSVAALRSIYFSAREINEELQEIYKELSGKDCIEEYDKRHEAELAQFHKEQNLR